MYNADIRLAKHGTEDSNGMSFCSCFTRVNQKLPCFGSNYTLLDGSSELGMVEDSVEVPEAPIFINAFKIKLFMLHDLSELAGLGALAVRKGG